MTRPPDARPQDDLVGNNLEERTVWNTAEGGFIPKAGCATVANPEENKIYNLGALSRELLPLVMKEPKRTDEEREILRKALQGDWGAGVAVMNQWEHRERCSFIWSDESVGTSAVMFVH